MSRQGICGGRRGHGLGEIGSQVHAQKDFPQEDRTQVTREQFLSRVEKGSCPPTRLIRKATFGQKKKDG